MLSINILRVPYIEWIMLSSISLLGLGGVIIYNKFVDKRQKKKELKEKIA